MSPTKWRVPHPAKVVGGIDYGTHAVRWMSRGVARAPRSLFGGEAFPRRVCGLDLTRTTKGLNSFAQAVNMAK
eukprot:633678-Amorphochlora_amoeboformis.AAC.1